MYDYNYQDLLNIKYKKYFIEIMIGLLIITFILITIFIKCYDTLNVVAINSNNYIAIKILKENSDTVKNSNYLLIDNNKEKYTYEIISYGSLEVDINNNIYQEIIIKIDYDIKENEIIDLKFYYNEERIINKIVNKIF